MQISIRGESPAVTKKEIRYATEFMSALIMSPNLRSRLSVCIQFVPKLIGEDFKSLHATSEWLDDNHRPREFKICINSKLCRKKQLLALAHEIVHVKQWSKGEMQDTMRGPSHIKWKAEYIPETVHYYDLPWEVEAHGRELGMWVRYTEHLRHAKVKL
jgi:hypothetical protein